MHTVGRHLLVELYQCPPELLDDVEVVRAAIHAATRATGASIVSEAYHRFQPQGVSCSVLIAESHVSVHTWPEAGYAAADLYTCGDLDPWLGIQELSRRLGARSMRTAEIVRGLDADLAATTASGADRHLITALAAARPV